jgi:hypothetical protein
VVVDSPPDKQSPVVGLLVPPEPGLQVAAPRMLLTKERGLYTVTGVHAGEHVGLVKSEPATEDVLTDRRVLLVNGELVVKGVLTREHVVLFGSGPAVEGALTWWYVLLVGGALVIKGVLPR